MATRSKQNVLTGIHIQVAACRKRREPRLVARMSSGFAVMGASQFWAGYCLLLPDPVVGSLNDLDAAGRERFLRDMATLGDAVTSVVSPRRINYEILGNLEPALHAHVIPRRSDEPEELRTKAVWLYPRRYWEEYRFDPTNPEHPRLRDRIAGALVEMGAANEPGAEQRAEENTRTATDAPGLPAWAEAASFAARAHGGHNRKDGMTPYVSHPFRVAMIVRDCFGCGDPVALSAALLHDTIEDTRIDFDDIHSRFGAAVARCVAALSKDKRMPEPAREKAYEQRIAGGDWRARLVKLADVYDNLADLANNPGGVLENHRKKCRTAVELAHQDSGRPEIARAIRIVSAAAGLTRDRARRRK